jgi:hypothetical protein
MPDHPESNHAADRKNDSRLLTPLLLMALIIVAGIAYYALIGATPGVHG